MHHKIQSQLPTRSKAKIGKKIKILKSYTNQTKRLKLGLKIDIETKIIKQKPKLKHQ